MAYSLLLGRTEGCIFWYISLGMNEFNGCILKLIRFSCDGNIYTIL